MFERAEKTSRFDSWENKFKTTLRSRNMFCIKFHVLLNVLSFFPCWNTAILSARKQMSFRRRIFLSIPIHAGLHDWLQRWRPSYRSSSLRVHWPQLAQVCCVTYYDVTYRGSWPCGCMFIAVAQKGARKPSTILLMVIGVRFVFRWIIRACTFWKIRRLYFILYFIFRVFDYMKSVHAYLTGARYNR